MIRGLTVFRSSWVFGGLGVVASFLAGGCGDEGTQADRATGDPGQYIPIWESGLDSTRQLGSLSEQEVTEVCDSLVEHLEDAETLVACRVAGVSTTDDTDACKQEFATCEMDPTQALEDLAVTAGPVAVECSAFTQEALAGCEEPLSALEDCASALSNSLVPSAFEVSCDNASSFANLEEANEVVTAEQGQTFGLRCASIQENCPNAVAALLGEEAADQ